MPTPPYTPNSNSPQWPSNYQGCYITGQFLTLDGTPLAGLQVTLTASASVITNTAANVVIYTRPLVFTLNSAGRIVDSTGNIGVIVPATDDPDVQPNGWTYQVTEGWPGGRTYNITAPQNTTLDLSTVISVPAGTSGLVISAAGAALMSAATPAIQRNALGLGTAATYNVGTTSGALPALGTGGVLPIARLATGTPDGTKFIRDDGTLAVPAGGGGGAGSTAATTTFSPTGNIAATDVQGAIAELDAEKQPLDSDLTAIAALTTTTFGRSLLALADANALRTAAGLGTAATVNTGTASGNIPLLSTGGVLPIARLATGTPTGTKFIRDDGTLAVPPGSGTSSAGLAIVFGG